jgi:carboxyl-terminal processing protease
VKYLRCIALLCLMLPWAGPSAASPVFNDREAGLVWGSALAFIAPRTLTPLSMPQMAVWGLGGLTALDPDLTVKFQSGRMVLYGPNQILYAVPAPAGNNATAWGHVCAAIAGRAFAASPALRRAGTGGIIRSFFDELFNYFDPYSRYEAPGEAARDEAMRLGSAGLGITLRRIGGRVVVATVAPDSPADEADIDAGTAIVAINGIPVAGRTLAVLNAELTGPQGAPVRLTLRDARGSRRFLRLAFARVPRQTVFGTMRQHLATIRITEFGNDTAVQFAAMLEGLLSSPTNSAQAPRGVVIDLRGNRGGLLRQAALTADTLLGHGTIIQTIGRDPAADKIWRAEGADLAQGLPVVVLVDGQTASAAVAFAAALADNDRAVVVGSATLGKGLVQSLTILPNGGELFVTWSRMIAPLGWPLQGLGVMPQICTSLGSQVVKRQLATLQSGRDLMAKAVDESRRARAPMPLPEVLAIRDACPAVVGGNGDLRAARGLIDDPFAYRSGLIRAILRIRPYPGPRRGALDRRLVHAS